MPAVTEYRYRAAELWRFFDEIQTNSPGLCFDEQRNPGD